MNEDVVVLTAIFSGVVVVLSLVAVHGSHKAQEVQEAWRKLADRYRLQYEPRNSPWRPTQVSGSLAERPFALRQTGSGNQSVVQMELELRGTLPGGLHMKPIGKHVAAHVEVLGVPATEIVESSGEVKINGEISVKAADPEELHGYLTPERKRGALSFAHVGGELDSHKLRVKVAKDADDLDKLDETVRVLLDVAPVLDTA